MDLELTRIFVKVVQNGSFSRAADLLKRPKSTVSKAISRLESESGTRLLLRTTRSLTLTASGRSFYESTVGPIQLLEDAQKSLHGQDSIVSGLVKITAPEDLGSHVIAPSAAELSQLHPSLRFELEYTDEMIDLVKDGFDLAVRIGRLAESSFKVKRLGEIFLIMVASPEYLKSREKIKTPKDLEAHDCLSYSDQAFSNRWSLKSQKGTYTFNTLSKISSNQMSSLLRAARAGGGVALVPRYLCLDEIKSKQLVQVLPDWSSPGLPVSLVSPLSFSSSVRLKIVTEHLIAALQKSLTAV